MGKQSLVSDTISSTRILSHGKIKSLADGFSLPNLVNFILYVRPKDNVEINASDIILSVNCMKDDGFKEAPFKLNEWSPLYLEEIAAGQDEILSKVDLFWGAGDFIIKGKGEVKTKPCAKVLTYTGEAQELVTAGEGTGTMLYKLGDGEWDEIIPSAINAGCYHISFKSASNDFNEESLVESIDVVVAKASRTISFISIPLNVTAGEEYAIAATPSAGATDGTISYCSSNPKIVAINGNTAIGMSAGVCNLVAVINGGVNYVDAEVMQEVTSMVHEYANDYLTFIPVEDSTFGFSKAGLSYSLDNGSTWTELEADGTTPTVVAGSKILWKNNTELTPSSKDGIGTFSSSKVFDVQGNIMSLLFGDNFVGQTSLSGRKNAFYRLFKQSNVRKAANLKLYAMTLADSCYSSMFLGCTSLTSAPVIQATTMKRTSCYSMFQGCTSLTTAPALPATRLDSGCYMYMFQDCTSLTTAPALPATTLESSCYYLMFYNCTSLNYVKMLATNVNATSCLTSWLSGVAATGTFVKAEGAEIPSGTSGIPEGWTVETYTPAA